MGVIGVANMRAAWTRFFRPRNNDSISTPSMYDEKCDGLEVNVTESSPRKATGAVKIEAVEAVGGRKGRYLLYIGYVCDPIFIQYILTRISISLAMVMIIL
jgi:hypothetical protein